MWIPYFLLEFWELKPNEVRASEKTKASDADGTVRDFKVVFFLENPTGRRNEVELSLDEDVAKKRTDASNREAVIHFHANANKQLDAIAFRVKDVNRKLAFRYCYDTVSPMLSSWTLFTGSGFSIHKCKVIDNKHQVEWNIVPQYAAPDTFTLPYDVAISPEHNAMLSLYREARCSQSPFYRFLCCYKILEAWYKHGSVFGRADRLVKERGLSFRRPKRKITQDFLVYSLVFTKYPEFTGISFVKFFELLNPWRTKVAHALTDEGKFVNFDLYESQLDLGPIANLTDLVARQVLMDEIILWSQIAQSGRLSTK